MLYNSEVLAALVQAADSTGWSSQQTKAIWNYLLNQHTVTKLWSVRAGQIDPQRPRHVETDLALVYHPIGVEGSKPFPVILLDTFKPKLPLQGSNAVELNLQEVKEYEARSPRYLSTDADFFGLQRMWGVSAVGRKFKLWVWDVEELLCLPYTVEGRGGWLDIIQDAWIIQDFVNEAMGHADILADAMGQIPDGFPDTLVELLGEAFSNLSASTNLELGNLDN